MKLLAAAVAGPLPPPRPAPGQPASMRARHLSTHADTHAEIHKDTQTHRHTLAAALPRQSGRIINWWQPENKPAALIARPQTLFYFDEMKPPLVRFDD